MERTTRRWIGSNEHKHLFCAEFERTHVPFEPEEIRWPDLDSEALSRLRGLPIWNEAVRTEAITASEVSALGRTETDEELASAIALQGYEEHRHAAVLRLLTLHYGIDVAPFDAPDAPKDPLWTFMSTGYGECLDSFFAFGLFALGRRSRYFPEALISIFDPIMQEEARHILFIVNWAAYLRSRTGSLLRPVFDLRRTWTIAAQVAAHVRQAARLGGEPSQEGFTMNSHGAFGELSARSFLELCLAENDRRLRSYDAHLLRPRLVPSAARLALKFLPGPPPGVAGDGPGAGAAHEPLLRRGNAP
jgi:hypothetical protein